MRNFEDKEMLLLPVECVTVAEWCPNPDRENPTQVHMIIELDAADFSMALRFSGTETLDKIINALIESRRRVFPDAPRIEEKPFTWPRNCDKCRFLTKNENCQIFCTHPEVERGDTQPGRFIAKGLSASGVMPGWCPLGEK